MNTKSGGLEILLHLQNEAMGTTDRNYINYQDLTEAQKGQADQLI
jgi:hypothetical protein